MKAEEFITFKPKNEILATYISYYYFHDSIDNSLHKKYLYYPNYKNALTIYKDSEVAFSENFSVVKPQKGSYSFLYSGIQKKSRVAEIIAPFHKVGIVFQELGINHFIDPPLCEMNNDSIDKSFPYFEDSIINVLEELYTTENIDEKISLLDSYFVSKLQEFDEPVLTSVVEYIISSNHKVSVLELSEKFNINKKTLLRLFKKHLCCSVKEYIDIVHFRKALNLYLENETSLNFTNTALETDYYDQSQFINHFKKLTGINPKSFFNSIDHVGEEDTYWNFMK